MNDLDRVSLQGQPNTSIRSFSNGSSPVRLSAYIRIISQIKQDRPYCYAVLNWNRGKVTKSLGIYPYLSPTPLLDTVLFATIQPGFLSDEELTRLLYADKSYRPFVYRWAHYAAFLEMQRKKPAQRIAVTAKPPAKVTPVRRVTVTPQSDQAQPESRQFHGLITVAQKYIRLTPAAEKLTPNTPPANPVASVPKDTILTRIRRRFGLLR